MRTGDIILVHSEGFLPDIIQRFQKLEGKDGWELNHAGIYINVLSHSYISEMVACGCVSTPWSEYEKKIKEGSVTVLRGKPKDIIRFQETEAIIDLAICSAGRVKYEKKNLCIEQPVRILSEFLTGNEWWIGAKKEKKAEKRQICGEYAAFHYFKLRNYFKDDWFKFAPIDLFNSGLFEWNVINTDLK